MANQLQSALESRILIEQAKGALAQLIGSTTRAFDRLRTYARERGLKLTEVARTITTHPESLSDLVRR